ncbi:UvrD-helicase domain-containing protein [Niveispirillum lacus]|nr:UvrD-helicase domain-containing protein [Niveispirillum lacus]
MHFTRRSEVTTISLLSLARAPTFREGVLGAVLTISSDEHGDVTLKGAANLDARQFSKEVKEAWVRSSLAALERETVWLDSILAGVQALAAPSSYPAACQVAPLLEKARALDVKLLSKLRAEAVGPDAMARVAPAREFVSDPRTARAAGISAFVTAELERRKHFFDTVESRELTPEQRLSVVVDEDATLVLAGAGSGKTSVIAAKAIYLVRAGIRQPEEILLLAFGKKAARQMSERVEARSGEPIVARTFHAIANDIIGIVEGTKPPLAAHADDELAYFNVIRQILNDLVHRLPNVSTAAIQWFAHFMVEPKTEWNFKTKHDFYTHMEAQDLRTLQGGKVKSYEELQIANWLYENGIEYEYEPPYEHKVPETGRRDYQPDFRLRESGIYIEHFGVRREKTADGGEQLVTAPFVDRDEYLASMEWKRRVHAEHGTILIETYSGERQDGRLLTGLAEKLAPHVTLKPRPADTIYDRIVEMKQVDDFSTLLGIFLRKFKEGGYSLQDCRDTSKKKGLGNRASAFLDVFAAVFEEYQRQLDDRIDFEDMVLRAARYVETGRYTSPFRHILVDEFQDISPGRARLLKALKNQHPDVRIFAVGDDWQAIYRFAGSDLHLMRHFGREFGGRFDGEADIHRTVDLGRTFRSVDQIAFAARTFVLRNPAQIRKQVVPAGTATEPAIKIVTVPKHDSEAKLSEVLNGLSATVAPGAEAATALLLGRYSFIKPDMSALKARFPRLEISFDTIHASKGSEADHVIVLNANSGRFGFPSEIVDDSLLSMVSPEEEAFPNAEERRVMYVAMTRARHTLTILASNARPSSFVTELREDPAYGIVSEPGGKQEDCVCGECGGRLLGVAGRNGHIRYRCEHDQHCGNSLPACPACQTALPHRTDGTSEVRCECGACFPACPECKDGWLVERNGSHGNFLSCARFPACFGKPKAPRGTQFSTPRTRRRNRF